MSSDTLTLMTFMEAGYRDLTCRFRVSIKIADQQHSSQLSTQVLVRSLSLCSRRRDYTQTFSVSCN